MEAVFTIIIPTHNNTLTIAQTIDSVRNQLWESWEIVVVDDGSTDGTRDLMRNTYGSDARIKYRYIEKSGVTAARNVGVNSANGQYLVFLDADDQLTPDALSSFMEKITSENEPGFVSGAYFNVKRNALVLPRLQPKWFFDYRVNTLSGTFCMQKKIFLEVGGYDKQLTQSENWELLIRVLAACRKKGLPVAFTDSKVLTYNNMHSDHKLNKKAHDRAESFKYLFEKFKKQNLFNRRSKQQLAEIAAHNLFRLSKKGEAIGWQWRAICVNPAAFYAYLRLIKYILK